jgi:hypothetical protein
MLRRLRIAVSIASAIACGLLVPLWAGSYRYGTVLQGAVFSQRVQISSEFGRLILMVIPNVQSRNFPSRSWSLSTYNAVEMLSYDHEDSAWGIGSFLPQGNEIRMPHWFLVFISGTIALAFGILWPIRFSLRTMLITTAVVAVSLSTILGLASVLPKGYAVQEIRLKQGRIQYTIAGPPSAKLRQLQTFDCFGFSWQGTWHNLIFTIPDWLIVLCSTVLLATAWLRWKERFGVRTLSIATAIGVAEFALVAWAIH